MMRNNTPATLGTDSQDTYPVESNTATPSCLVSLLKQRITTDGPLPFDQWMQECLYHPDWGYYRHGEQKVGREGDFFTSISVGQCFGMLLSYRLADYASTHPSYDTFDLIELGANTGQLACDILDSLRDNFPKLYKQVCYTICEPLPSMRKVQLATLADHHEKVDFHDNLAAIHHPKKLGVILSNELIDAFPVKLITKLDGQWHELHVGDDNGQFAFTHALIDEPSPLQEFCKTLPPLPDGYTTEYRPNLETFAQACASALENGMLITIDYGYVQSDFYAERRSTGTLRTFHNQKAGENPLILAGEQDITAHVDFTQLAAAFQSAGFAPQYFESQSRFLIHVAKPWFKSIEDSQLAPPAKLIRQFQTLTHPSMMGNQFSILECSIQHPPQPSVLAKLELC